MINALSKLIFLSKLTSFDILPHLSTASRGKSNKIFFPYSLDERTFLLIYGIISAGFSIS